MRVEGERRTDMGCPATRSASRSCGQFGLGEPRYEVGTNTTS